jgi:hypothetical protein
LVWAYYVGFNSFENIPQFLHPPRTECFADYFQRPLRQFNFREKYEEEYAKEYGKYRIERITEVVEEFIKCGDYRQGLLFSNISNLIFDMIQSYYNEAASKRIRTGMILSCQTSGDFTRWNSHWHALLIEGGFDAEGRSVFLPISSTVRMTELFRRLMIKPLIFYPVK